jgi:hypothetical protein
VIRNSFFSVVGDGQSSAFATALEMNCFPSFLVVLQLLSIINVYSLQQANTVNKNRGSCSTFRSTLIPKRSFQHFSSADDSTFGPACVIVAGLPEIYLESVDDIFSAALGILPPVVIVSSEDFSSKLKLKKLLDERDSRDHSLTGKLCQLPSPVIIFAGCDRSAIRLSIRSYKTWNPPQSGPFPKTAFAVVVENALDKTIKDLCEEILGDFRAEQEFKAKAS